MQYLFSISYKIMEQFTPGHSYWNKFREIQTID